MPMAIKSNTTIVIAIFLTGLLIAAAVIFGTTLRERLFHSGSDEGDDWKQYVARQMIDPASTQFRNTRKAVLGYCGEINSKNRFGGYVGFKDFHAFEDSSGDWIVTVDPSLVNIICK